MVITGVGMATAQGPAARVREDAAPYPPEPLPWPVRASAQGRTYRPARDTRASGMDRVVELARRALVECGVRAGEPVVLASCNGGATTFEPADWRASFELGRALGGELANEPVASAACASGIHGLYLARARLEAGAESVVVLAVDIASQPSHDNFESLRIVADEAAPYQDEAAGFVVGEAAVAIRIARRGEGIPFTGPVLGHDLTDDALVRVLGALPPREPGLVLGQATGPAFADRVELGAIATRAAREVPLATASYHFGHALGASSLLSVALAALARESIPRALALPRTRAADGRPLVTGPARAAEVLVACRALGGACGACIVGGEAGTAPRTRTAWRPTLAPPPMRHPWLRGFATAASAARPTEPPDLVIVTLDAPLAPPDDAWVGKRLLPSSVLELTPGFVTQLIVRTWGFAGPALTLVGGDPANSLAACRRTHDRVFHVAIRGMDDHRDVEWNG